MSGCLKEKMGREQGMFLKAFHKQANRISMLVALAIVLYALLWNEGGENLNKPTDSAFSAVQIITLGNPLVRIESTDEVYEAILQAVIVYQLFEQSFRSKEVSEFTYAILELLLAAVTVMLLHRSVHIWFHRSQGGIVCYIHDQDGKK